MGQIHWKSAISADFNTAGDWSSGTVPGVADDAILDAAGAAFTVTASIGETVNSIQLASNATLDINARTFTATNGTGAGANAGTIAVGNNAFFAVGGTVNDTGAITLNSTGNTTELIFNANTTLTGGGRLTLSDNSNNYLLGATASTSLTNLHATISGSGHLGSGAMTFVNQAAGVVNATGANALVLDTAGQTVTNAGLLEGSGTAGLTILSTTINGASGGLIQANTASAVNLQGADIVGGTLKTVGTGVIQAVDRTSQLDGTTSAVNNTGVLNIVNNQFLTVIGTIANTGSINLNTTGNTTEMIVGSAGVTLNGGGKVALSNFFNNYILGSGASSTLTNVDNTIAGSGHFGDGQMTFVNQAAGLIDATGSSALIVNTGASTVKNAGLMEGTGSGGLLIQSTTVANAGTLLAAAGSFVNLQSADIQGGTFATSGTGVVQAVDRGSVLDGTVASVSNTGVFDVLNNQWVYIQGTIANATGATLNMLSTGADTRIIATAANATLTGGGVVLSDNGNNTIQGTVTGPSGSQVASTLTNKTTISGAGLFGNGSLTLVNTKTIDATGANALIIDVGGGNFASSSTVSNTGLLEATNPGALKATGGLDIRSDTIANGTTGVIEANGAATHVDLQSSTIQGGTLTTLNGGVIQTFSSDRNSLLDGTLHAVKNTGVLDVTNNAWLYLQGTIANTGTVNVQSGGNDTRLRMNANTVLTGGGPIVLTDNSNNTIDAVSGAITLTNVSSTISGAGALGNASLTFTNDAAGVVDATGTANALHINTSGETLTNLGLLEATGAAGMVITSTVVDDTGGGMILAATGSSVLLQAASVVGGTLLTSGSGVIATAGADRNSVLDGTAKAVNNTGVLDVTNNAWLYLQGAIHNTGTINVGSVGNDTRLRMSANTVLSGGGPVVLSDNLNNTVDAGTAGSSLTNVSSTISGAGFVGGNGLVLINDAAGAIDANGSNRLTLDTSNTVTNLGLIEATGAGGLLIESTTVDDSSGSTIAVGNGSTVTLQSSLIIGGTLSSTGTGVFGINDRGSVLDGKTATLTLAGTFNVTNNEYLYIQGTIDNTGTINVASGGNDTRLRMNANTVLTGGGPIVLTDNTNNTIDAGTAGSSLTNVSSTISGAGVIGGNGLVVINDAAGVIDGTGANRLTLDTSNTVTNSGLIEATGSGGMLIESTTVNGSTGGTISAGNGSAVTLQSSTITGGTLSSTGSGLFQINDRNSILDGTTSILNNAAIFNVTNNNYLYIQGAIDNTGSINLVSGGNDTRLRLNMNTVLTGGGVIFLNGNSNNIFKGAVAGLTLTNDGNILEGSGNLFGGNSLILINNKGGVVDGNATTALVLSTSGATITNAGTFEGTGSGGLTISKAVVADTGGMITAGAGSNVTLVATMLTGGSFSTAATGEIVIGDGSTAIIDGVISNAGTILVNASKSVTSLIFAASASLSGGGVLGLSANKDNVVTGTKSTIVLTNVNDTIEGAGKLGNGKMTLVNDLGGVIDANSTAGLTIATGPKVITNAGLIEASNKGRGTIASAVDNTGTIEANGGTLMLKAAVTGSGAVDIVSGTLIVANANAAENVAFTGKTGKLELTQSQTYSGGVSGFSLVGKTSLDLRDIGFVSATEATFNGTTSSGVLTVSDGVHTAHITLIGNYTASTFVASSDGAGGVTVVDPTPPPSVPHFAAAMAGLGGAGGVTASKDAAGGRPLTPLLATPSLGHG